MEKSGWKTVHAEMREAVEAIARKHGLKLKTINSRHSDWVLTTKIVVESTEAGAASSRAMEAAADWRFICTVYGLKEEWMGKTFSDGRETYEIIGCNPKARKNPVLVKMLRNGKTYCCPPEMVKRGFGKA